MKKSDEKSSKEDVPCLNMPDMQYPLWVIEMPWKVHELAQNIFLSTFNPWAPKLSIANFVTQDYSHILHVYFVGVFCYSHPYMNVILS